MKRYDIINKIIQKKGFKSYLEIGLDRGQTFNQIKATEKFSVDPAKNRYEHATPTHLMTSDEFFENNKDTFDIIFIDGLHHSEQVYRDIKNSIDSLNPGGVVVCHDMNPQEEAQQIVPRQQTTWTGDCWKALVQFRQEHLPYKVAVVDTDWGVGIIEESDAPDNLVITDELTFKNFVKNRNQWLNLIPVQEFKRRYG
jgi:SAM-dependent methyltransferase